MNNPDHQEIPDCAHCGEHCIDEIVCFDEKEFCCTGCKTVYEILSDNNLCDYYEIDNPNLTVKTTEFGKKYAYLDNPDIEEKLYQFANENYRIIKLFVPVIHCASCIWLLENLAKLSPGVISSQVNFVKKVVTINFNKDESSLRSIVEIMASIGYPPDINLEGFKKDKNKKRSRELLVKMGVAGFSFGNIMLMSFPEYFSFQFQDESQYVQLFAYLNLILSLPVFFYCAPEYFNSAYKGLKHKIINLDVPISLGIIVLFLKSAFDILTQSGPGYLDSLTGLVFYLLIGKWFQNKTYQALSFERDYKSYFPLAVSLIENNTERSILANQLKKGDEIEIKNEELIPADSILISEKAEIDYSFVTGESQKVLKQKGDLLYAGGRQMGGLARMVVQEKVSQSYLTDLWNQSAFQKSTKNEYSSLIDRVSQYFTIIIISIAFLTGLFWLVNDSALAIETFTAVLIIACPCALALSLPFALGNSIRVFGRNGFFAKNSQSIENLSEVDTLVFDKTGTLTTNKKSEALFYGEKRLTASELNLVHHACKASSHPISVAIASSIKPTIKIQSNSFNEIIGRGIEANINDISIRIGSNEFCNSTEKVSLPHAFVEINGELKGYYTINKANRKGLEELIDTFKSQNLDLHLLSGDNSTDQQAITSLFPNEGQVNFNQSPQDKLNYITALQNRGKKVMMLGDGLNDAGALKAANVGIAVSEDVYSFSPACDGILDANRFESLNDILIYSKDSMKVVRWSFALSFIYNIVGLFFAVQGLLTPIVAAILMPLSSITVVIFVTILTNVFGRIRFK